MQKSLANDAVGAARQEGQYDMSGQQSMSQRIQTDSDVGGAFVTRPPSSGIAAAVCLIICTSGETVSSFARYSIPTDEVLLHVHHVVVLHQMALRGHVLPLVSVATASHLALIVPRRHLCA